MWVIGDKPSTEAKSRRGTLNCACGAPRRIPQGRVVRRNDSHQNPPPRLAAITLRDVRIRSALHLSKIARPIEVFCPPCGGASLLWFIGKMRLHLEDKKQAVCRPGGPWRGPI